MSRPSDLAGPPREPVPPPAPILAELGPDAVAIWVNGAGGTTFHGEGRFAKWSPAGTIDLAEERERLDWLRDRHPVPRVLAFGADASSQWLVTAAIGVHGAVDPAALARPEAAVEALGTGLRRLHDALDPAECPFDWSTDRRRPPGFPEPPAIDRLVVCHGDPCAPNTVLDAGLRFAGHVDLGRLGVADRWADLAVAIMSLDWNYGPGWQDAFLAAYGIDPDPVRIDYYRRLWDAEED